MTRQHARLDIIFGLAVALLLVAPTSPAQAEPKPAPGPLAGKSVCLDGGHGVDYFQTQAD